MNLTLALAILLCTPALAPAKPVYHATVVDHVDGDTLAVQIHVWPPSNLVLPRVLLRLRGIDTPEKRGKCQAERLAATHATQRVAELAPLNSPILIEDPETGTFAGRVIAQVLLPNQPRTLSDLLLEEGWAVEGRSAPPIGAASSNLLPIPSIPTKISPCPFSSPPSPNSRISAWLRRPANSGISDSSSPCVARPPTSPRTRSLDGATKVRSGPAGVGIFCAPDLSSRIMPDRDRSAPVPSFPGPASGTRGTLDTEKPSAPVSQDTAGGWPEMNATPSIAA